VSENQPRSGSRWEPAPADAPQHNEHATGLLDHAEPPVRAARPARRRRMVVAAVGAGLLLVGGAGGYAIGHATAGTAAPSERGHRDGGFRGLPGDTTGDDSSGTGPTGPST
jgi:hypothetical protein